MSESGELTKLKRERDFILASIQAGHIARHRETFRLTALEVQISVLEREEQEEPR